MDNAFSLALTFDDVLLKPRYTGFDRSEIDLSTKITKNIPLSSPLVASPMDTVTESRLAIELARLGGIGFIHRNLSIDNQADEVKKTKDQNLLVGAAVGSSKGFIPRVDRLVKSGADIILVDSAHGYSKNVILAVKEIKSSFKVDVIAGNVATADGAKALIEAGADAVRVGMGPGAICSTRIVSGMGVPQLTAIIETVKIAKHHNIPVIADGGINYSADLVKALAAGASTVMMGRFFAATEESPGEIIELTADKVPDRFKSITNGSSTHKFKIYRGMGSVAAMEKGMEVSSEDEFHGKSYKSSDVLVAEGVEGMVPVTGTVRDVVEQLIGGIKSGFYYTGAKSISELWQTAEFQQVTQASLTESHPHDLYVTDSGNKQK